VKQELFWKGDFGKEYTERNTYSPDELDQLYLSMYGLTRTSLNEEFVGDFKNLKILEVGCNVGNQLGLLQRMGFADLTGVELQPYAVDIAKDRLANVTVLQGNAAELPFDDASFDLVLTSGVLIHIPPSILGKVMSEIVRVSKSYIWGLEYYADQYQDIEYRGEKNVMWKGDFATMFLEASPSLEIVKKKLIKYVGSDNEDIVYLLKK
jgi:pseudaminic acid biosynthesis-associated methylase